MAEESTYWQQTARSISRRRLVAGLGASAAGLALAACGGSTAKPAASPGTTTSGATAAGAAPVLNVKRGGTFNTPSTLLNAVLDPHQATFPNMLQIWHNISHHLIELDEKLQPTKDGLAQSWEIPDKTSLVFKLYPGVKFHDKPPANGRVMTAEDVVYSLSRISTPEARFARRSEFSQVDKIEAPDAQTVKITLKQPYVPMLMYLGTMYNVIVNKEAVEKYGDLARPESSIGVGPFMLDRYDKESGATLVKNPNYFRKDLPYLDKIEITVFADPAPRQAALRAGQIHFSDEQIRFVPELMKANPKFQQVKTANTFLSEFGMNATTVKQFADPRVRQAIFLVLDRDKALAATYGARENGVYAAPVPTLLDPYALSDADLAKIPGYRQPKDQDIADAKKLMAAAGYPDGFKVNAKTANEYKDAIEPFIPDLKQLLGIDVNLQVLEWGAYKQAESLKQVEAFGTGYQVEPEADANLRLFSSSTGTRNYVGFSDAKADDLINKQAAEYDVSARSQIVKDAIRYLIPLAAHGWQFGAAWIYRLSDPKVHGIFTVPANPQDRQDYTRVWIG
ncbi:MAG: ABC transporter substrate-binding protein [Dehalococcoidia bacterium]